MKKVKPAISLVLALSFILVLAACGGTASSPPAESTSSPLADDVASPAPEASTWEPEKTVEMIVIGAAGGATDLLARAIEGVWSNHCDQPLLITNMPGGGGVTGAMAVASSEPDGYTIEMGYGSGNDMAMMYLQELEYDPFTMLEPLCLMSVHNIAIVAPIDSEFNTMADVVEWAEAHPDTPVTASVATANGNVDLVLQAVRQCTGIDMSIVPHDGGAQAMTDLLSGSYMIGGGHPAEIYSYIESGQLKAIAVSGEERDPAFPDVPTLKEQGIDFSSYGSIKGLAVPVGTPDEIKQYYEALFAEIAADPEFEEKMSAMAQPVVYMDTEEFTQFFADANADNKRLIEDLGLAYYQ